MCHALLVFQSAEKTGFENCTPFQRLRILSNLHTCLVLTQRIDGRAVTPACMVIRRVEFAIWRMCERWIRATAIHDKMTKRYLWCCCTNGRMNLRMHTYTHIWFKCVCVDVVPCSGKSCTNIASTEICIYVYKIRLRHKYTCHSMYYNMNVHIHESYILQRGILPESSSLPSVGDKNFTFRNMTRQDYFCLYDAIHTLVRQDDISKEQVLFCFAYAYIYTCTHTNMWARGVGGASAPTQPRAIGTAGPGARKSGGALAPELPRAIHH